MVLPSTSPRSVPQQQGVDLWNHTAPAIGQNGTYGGYSFTEQAVDAITRHDQTTPFFMFVAFQNMHPPLQVPDAFVKLYPAGQQLTINGMACGNLDIIFDNVSRML